MDVDFQQIEARKQTLELARADLKAHFVGIDDIIDDLLNYIQIWYLMPEILSRPIVVNLWGMTGVDGTPVQTTKYTDFWELLSDGKLSKRDKVDLDYYLQDYLF
jgi:cell division protease FtsH